MPSPCEEFASAACFRRERTASRSFFIAASATRVSPEDAAKIHPTRHNVPMRLIESVRIVAPLNCNRITVPFLQCCRRMLPLRCRVCAATSGTYWRPVFRLQREHDYFPSKDRSPYPTESSEPVCDCEDLNRPSENRKGPGCDPAVNHRRRSFFSTYRSNKPACLHDIC